MFRILYWLFWGPLMLLLRVHPHHRERIPKKGVLLCPNHTSMLDVIVLYRVFYRKIHFMAKKEAFRQPLVGWFLRQLGAFPVDRGGADAAAIRRAAAFLDKGELVCLFPQGTRHPGEDPKNTKVFGGIGFLAAHTGADILPIRIWNPENQVAWLRRTDLIVGEPIPAEQLPLKEKSIAAYNEAARIAFEKVCELHP